MRRDDVERVGLGIRRLAQSTATAEVPGRVGSGTVFVLVANREGELACAERRSVERGGTVVSTYLDLRVHRLALSMRCQLGKVFEKADYETIGLELEEGLFCGLLDIIQGTDTNGLERKLVEASE